MAMILLGYAPEKTSSHETVKLTRVTGLNALTKGESLKAKARTKGTAQGQSTSLAPQSINNKSKHEAHLFLSVLINGDDTANRRTQAPQSDHYDIGRQSEIESVAFPHYLCKMATMIL